jgi:septal ring factor EnvC (AmiA/AmiB activator)
MAEGSSGLKLDGTISLGHLMAAIPAITIAFSILWWVVGYTSRIENNAKRIDALEQEDRATAKELREELAVLPDLKAHIAAAERAIDDLRTVNQAQQDRINDARTQIGQAVDVLKEIYQPAIPVRRTR